MAGTSPATSPKGRGGRVSSFPVRLPLYRTNGPAGGIGRRSRFRSCRREAWGFESLAGHHRHYQHRTGRFERSGEPRRRRVSCPARRDRTGSAEAEPRTGCGAPARAAREGRPSARPSTDPHPRPRGGQPRRRPRRCARRLPDVHRVRLAHGGRGSRLRRLRRRTVERRRDRRDGATGAGAGGEEAGGGAGGGGAGGSAAGVTEPVVATSTRAAGLASRASASRCAARAPARAGSAARGPTGGTAARQSRV